MTEMQQPTWGTANASYREKPVINKIFFVALALVPTVVAILAIVATQKNLGPINCFSALGIGGSVGLMALSGILLICIYYRKKEPAITVVFNEKRSQLAGKEIFCNAAANTCHKPLFSTYPIYIMVKKEEAWPIIQKAISSTNLQIWTVCEEGMVTIKIRRAHENSEKLPQFLQKLAQQLNAANIEPLQARGQLIKMDGLHQYFYCKCNVLPKFLSGKSHT